MAQKKLGVFVSFSGEGEPIAKATAKFLTDVFPNEIEVFVSSLNLTPGKSYAGQLEKGLKTADLGIVCVTPSDSGWMHFELGVLYGKQTPVYPIVYHPQNKGPVHDYLQYLVFSKDAIATLVERIAEQSNAKPQGAYENQDSYKEWLRTSEEALASFQPRVLIDDATQECPPEHLDNLARHMLRLARFYKTAESERMVPDHLDVIDRDLRVHLENLADRSFQFEVHRVESRWEALLKSGSESGDELRLMSSDGLDFWDEFFREQEIRKWYRVYHEAIQEYRGKKSRTIILGKRDLKDDRSQRWVEIVGKMIDAYDGMEIRLVTESEAQKPHDFCIVGDWALSEFRKYKDVVYGLKHSFATRDVGERSNIWEQVGRSAELVTSVGKAAEWFAARKAAS